MPKVKLKSKAKKNTRVEKKTKEGVEVIKEGTPKEHSISHNVNREGYNPRTVGVNLGITKNMDNYESLRVDCWLTDEVLEGESHSEAYQRVSEVAYAQLQEEVARFI